jgi:hypothetical protein
MNIKGINLALIKKIGRVLKNVVKYALKMCNNIFVGSFEGTFPLEICALLQELKEASKNCNIIITQFLYHSCPQLQLLQLRSELIYKVKPRSFTWTEMQSIVEAIIVIKSVG